MSKNGTILVVDDEVGPRECLRMILNPLYEVHTAADSGEALRYIRDNRVDLVTLDLKMPGLSGIDLLKEIRKLQPDTEVIIISSYGTLDNAHEAIRFGAASFISKPFNVTEIITAVAKSFGHRRYKSKVRDLINEIKSLRSSVR